MEALRVSISMTGRVGLEPSDKMLSSPLSQSLSVAGLPMYEKKISIFDTHTVFSKLFLSFFGGQFYSINGQYNVCHI